MPSFTATRQLSPPLLLLLPLPLPQMSSLMVRFLSIVLLASKRVRDIH